MNSCGVLAWERFHHMMTSSNGNIFRVTGLLCGEFTGLVNSPYKGQWRGALMFSLICVWINGWVNNREAGDLRRHRGHYNAIVMITGPGCSWASLAVSVMNSCGVMAWERFHHMMTSSNGNIFRVTGPLCGEFTGPGEFPIQRPVTRSFDVFFDLRLNKRFSKQPWGWWFETPSWSL